MTDSFVSTPVPEASGILPLSVIGLMLACWALERSRPHGGCYAWAVNIDRDR
jgi:hypothetical protein